MGLPLSAWNLDTRGIYIYDDGFKFVVLFGMIVLPELAVNLLEKGFTTGFSKVSFSERVNQTARNLMSILEKLREDNGSCYQLPCIVKQGEFILTNLNKDPVDGLQLPQVIGLRCSSLKSSYDLIVYNGLTEH
ncbi:protein transport protein SEC24 A-like [Coffea arabica]|uniref:Protein transport protein SEC24 A-like n=1 Tax=Coffea arabica TaxID=13443 RepID=A0ABM4UG26_COFAR